MKNRLLRTLLLTGLIGVFVFLGSTFAMERTTVPKQKRVMKLKAAQQVSQSDNLLPISETQVTNSVSGQTAVIEVSGFGRTGAGRKDTSLYMAGDIAVAVFFTPGDLGGWTTQEMDDAILSIKEALNWFSAEEPNAHISFFYHDARSEVIPETIESMYDYANNLGNGVIDPNIYTHWVFLIEVINNGPSSEASSSDYLGPLIRIGKAYLNDLDPAYERIHRETAHVFGARYSEFMSPIAMSGYLGIVNANSEGNDGNGYFGGAGEGQPDIMLNPLSNILGVYTRGQLGWRDSDGDGILDVLDTYPDTNLYGQPSINDTGQLAFGGKVKDMPLFDEFIISTIGPPLPPDIYTSQCDFKHNNQSGIQDRRLNMA